MKVKKTLAAGLVLMMTAAGLYAQQAGQWTFGARAGMAFSFNETENFLDHFEERNGFKNTSSIAKDRMKMNFNAAFYVNRAVANWISFQAELNTMFNQGYSAEMYDPSYQAQYSWQASVHSDERIMTYTSLDIPLLVRFNFLTKKTFGFGLMAGPHISIPLGRMEVWTEIAQSNQTTNRDRYEGDTYNIDTFATFGFTAGLYGGYRIGPGRFISDLRYIYDFNSLTMTFRGIYHIGGFDTRSYDVMRRRALLLTLGYELSL